ncbi:MAG: sensor histidine kinase [Acidobacteria bacterium]|nr:sensor histidine kinase [Acidobacteriota bacterium]
MPRQSLEFANAIVAVTHAMLSEEARLLARRTQAARIHFVLVIAVLAATFSAAVLLLLWHHRLLRAELRAREAADENANVAAKAALESEEKAHHAERTALASRNAVGRLSARLLKLQDDERRRFFRELHDSIGQYLAATKMILSALAGERHEDPRYGECIGLLDQAIREVRTLSHQLHPASLDEAGFSSAVKWYAAEFAERSGLELKVDVPEMPDRLSPAIELALFRVVQESLTNVHRHSKSKSAEILVEIASGELTLMIVDHGVGIPEEVLNRFRVAGTSGVGLGGMHEWIRELRGRFEVESSPSGTCVSVTVPLTQPNRAHSTRHTAGGRGRGINRELGGPCFSNGRPRF